MNDLVDQLTDLFERLRRAGIASGVQEYMLLLEALRQGFGLSDRPALARLCRLVWVPSQEQAALFEHHFEAAIKVSLPIEPALVRDESLPPVPEMPKAGDVAAPQPVKQPPKPKLTPLPIEEVGQPSLASEVVENIERTIQADDVVARAHTVVHLTRQSGDAPEQIYPLATEFLPVSIRGMRQNWRYLRRLERTGPPVELDVQATVRGIGRTNYLLEPVMRPRRVNKAALLLLLDQKGSMVPFHFLGRRLEETATASGCFGKAGVFYFHDCPPRASQVPTGERGKDEFDHLLYQKPQCIDERPVSAIMGEYAYAHADVVIFSDAGAARGSWNKERIEATVLFLHQLVEHGIEQLVWLNPMPRDRWRETSAEAIAKLVPMFSIDAQSMEQAIRTLRGHTRFSLGRLSA